MATTTGSITVEQYRDLPEAGPFYYELHHGELVKVSRPPLCHSYLQERLRELLAPLLGSQGIILIELAFRALPEYELRCASVAFVTDERWRQADKNEALAGAPEIAIEVLSPSNSAAAMAEKCALCLQNGSRQFWTVDDRRGEIVVSTPDDVSRTYRRGDSIPLPFTGAGTLAVDSIFAE